MLLSWPPSLTWPRTLNPKPVSVLYMVTHRGPPWWLAAAALPFDSWGRLEGFRRPLFPALPTIADTAAFIILSAPPSAAATLRCCSCYALPPRQRRFRRAATGTPLLLLRVLLTNYLLLSSLPSPTSSSSLSLYTSSA